jgi:hydrogenase maturation protease
MKSAGPDDRKLMTQRVLIIAYGNPLRSDDGIAWHAADLLRMRLSSEDAEIICVHQLMPELAEAVSHSEGILFLDARANGKAGQILRTRVSLGAESPACSHSLTPEQLMAVSRLLYAVTPTAYEISITGESFTHGEDLSPKVKIALPLLVESASQVIKQIQRKPTAPIT